MPNQVSIFQPKSISDIYINISHFLDHFMMLIFAKAAYDAGKYFGLTYDEIIAYGAVGFLFFGAFAPLAAHLSDKISRSFLMIIYHFGIGLSSILAAISTSLWLFAVSLSLIGIFAAIYHPVGITMLLSKNKNNGIRMGINGVFGNMGVAAAPLITGLILFYGNWRLCFLLPGFFCIIYGLQFLKALTIEPSSEVNERVMSDRPFAKHWHRALSSIALSTLSAGFIFGAMTFLVPRYFETYLSNISTSVAVTGLLAGLVYAIASFAQIAVGKMIDKFSPKLILLIISVGQILFIYFSSIFESWSLFFITLFAMAFVFGQVPINDIILSRYVPDEKRAKILSIKYVLNLSAGASVLPICSLMMQNGFEMRQIFSMMSFMAVFILLAALLLPKQLEAERLDINAG
jgi:MFS family permease